MSFRPGARYIITTDTGVQDGTWEKIHDALREQVHQQAGRPAQLSAGVIDRQTVKTTEKEGFVVMTLARRSTSVSDMLSKDYEFLTESSQTMVYIAMIQLMLRRLVEFRTLS